MINERFVEYFRENFFQNKPKELEQFLSCIELSIPRTIRIKPGKEEQVRKNLEGDGWILTPTNINRVFAMDRREDFDPLERRLGFSSDHLLGNFYIQELAAAHPVDILAGSRINTESFLILDMAASPGGKTTQLAEYFPNSFIIANEPTRERLPQLLQNLERMGSANIGITLYPGQLYRHQEELFDRILLDAPCSGEGTLFKGTDAVKHWHLKNIKEIARLQTKLLDAALHTLKIGGEMIYSTCSLNLLENEGVLEAMREKYGNAFEIIFQKKFWPHIDKTGGFFVAKIRKISSLNAPLINENIEEKTEKEWRKSEIKNQNKNNKELKLFRGNISPWNTQDGITLYEHEGKILAIRNSDTGDRIRDTVFLMRYGEQIGTIEHGKFISGNRAWRYLDTSKTELYIISNIGELDTYLRGEPISNIGDDSYILITFENQILGLEYRKGDFISNTFSHEWRRK
ncbi:RsmB/NOP family class I SAM-dependent RNA methyltransferase [Candidatus Gracilibacteria bacterium]|nr:RsmB/NOP family class I SAM-dependent RNA methyltransferase [Candidatus Gracilibacteria bacterium]